MPVDPAVIAPARLLTLTPPPSPAFEERSLENTPFTKTTVCHPFSPKLNRSKSARLTPDEVAPSSFRRDDSRRSVTPLAASADSGVARRTRCSPIGATLVKCQSSFLVVGNPSAWQRAIPCFRRV